MSVDDKWLTIVSMCSCPKCIDVCMNMTFWATFTYAFLNEKWQYCNIFTLTQPSISWFMQCIMQTMYLFCTASTQLSKTQFSMQLAGRRVLQSVPTGWKGYFEREARLKGKSPRTQISCRDMWRSCIHESQRRERSTADYMKLPIGYICV